jgi:hypothetical protein
MTDYQTGWDLISGNIEKMANSQAKAQKAKIDLQTSVYLQQVKDQAAAKLKTAGLEQKYNYDLMLDKAKKAQLPPAEQALKQEYEQGQQGTPSDPEAPWGQGNAMIPEGQPTGQPNLGIQSPTIPTDSTVTIKNGKYVRMRIDDMAEQIFMKPKETWTPKDKQLIAQWQSMKQAERATSSTDDGAIDTGGAGPSLKDTGTSAGSAGSALTLEQQEAQANANAKSTQSSKYQIGQIIEYGGKKYKVTGGDLNDPDVQEVK